MNLLNYRRRAKIDKQLKNKMELKRTANKLKNDVLWRFYGFLWIHKLLILIFLFFSPPLAFLFLIDYVFYWLHVVNVVTKILLNADFKSDELKEYKAICTCINYKPSRNIIKIWRRNKDIVKIVINISATLYSEDKEL